MGFKPRQVIKNNNTISTFEAPSSPLCSCQLDQIFQVEFYFWMTKAQRGKGTCLKFQLVSNGGRGWISHPVSVLGNLIPSDPVNLRKGEPFVSLGPGHLWHLVPGTSCPVPQVPALCALADSFNPLACQPARVSSSSEFLQRSPQARSQLDAGDSSSRHMGMYLCSCL